MLPNPQIYGITIPWYSFFHYLGVIVAFVFAYWYYKKKTNLKLQLWQWAGLLVSISFCLMIGGRLIGFAEIYVRTGELVDWQFFLKGPSSGQFRWCGSLLLTILLLPIISKRILKIRGFYRFFDLLALSFCLLTIFTKQGCQFSGDGCYGIITNLPWGMFYPYGPAPNILPVHPTPIYDSLFHLLFFGVLLRWDLKRKHFFGQTALFYFTVTSVFYIALEFIRLNPEVAYGITLPQSIYVPIIFISVYLYLKLKNNTIYTFSS